MPCPSLALSRFTFPPGPEIHPWQPKAIAALSALVASEPLAAWKDLLAVHLVSQYSDVLPTPFQEQSFAFYGGSNLPVTYRGGVFVGEHGSWDRNPLNGYKVVFVPFSDGRPSGPAQDVVTGFLDSENRARGRPVGVAVDASGALLIADDLGDTVWRVSAAAS